MEQKVNIWQTIFQRKSLYVKILFPCKIVHSTTFLPFFCLLLKISAELWSAILKQSLPYNFKCTLIRMCHCKYLCSFAVYFISHFSDVKGNKEMTRQEKLEMLQTGLDGEDHEHSSFYLKIIFTSPPYFFLFSASVLRREYTYLAFLKVISVCLL